MTSQPKPSTPDERSSASVIYYGKAFRPYGIDWTKNGLLHYVPTDIIVDIINKNLIDLNTKKLIRTSLPSNWKSLPKEKIVSYMMEIYKRSPNPSKQQIENWVYSYRYKRKVQTDFPFLRRLETFYKFLRTNPYYSFTLSPTVATKVASQLSITGITDLNEVRSVLKSSICKSREEWKIFDSLFNKWFESNISSYQKSLSPSPSSTTISPSSQFLHFAEPSPISIEEALSRLRSIISPNSQLLDSNTSSDMKLSGNDDSESDSSDNPDSDSDSDSPDSSSDPSSDYSPPEIDYDQPESPESPDSSDDNESEPSDSSEDDSPSDPDSDETPDSESEDKDKEENSDISNNKDKDNEDSDNESEDDKESEKDEPEDKSSNDENNKEEDDPSDEDDKEEEPEESKPKDEKPESEADSDELISDSGGAF
jgi:hypothetical protein